MSGLAIEAHVELEQRLVAWLQSLQPIAGSPLSGVKIVAGHSEENMDNIASSIICFAQRADTQPYWQNGLEVCDVKVLIETQADDSNLAVHNQRVAGLRACFDLRNLPLLKEVLNAAPGFGLTGWMAAQPPVEDGFDSVKRRRQAVLNFKAVCGIET